MTWRKNKSRITLEQKEILKAKIWEAPLPRKRSTPEQLKRMREYSKRWNAKNRGAA